MRFAEMTTRMIADTSVALKAIHFRSRLLLGLSAGAILAACFPPYNLPILLPVGVAVLICSLRNASVREGFYTGLLSGIVFFGGTMFWLGNLFGPASISLIAIAGIFPAIFGALFARLTRRFPYIPEVMLAPLIWTAVEYFRSELFWLNFGWMGLGYGIARSHVANLCAPVVGSYGLSFLVVWFGCILVSKDGKWLERAGSIALALSFMLVPHRAPKLVHPLSVHMVQSYSDDEDAFFSRSKPMSGTHWDVILWPEYSFTSDPQRNPTLWTRLQSVARDNHGVFIFGGKDQFDPKDEAAFRNTAFVLDETGALIGKHVKNHTVHFVRDGVRGTVAKAILSKLGRLGVAICFDMDYPDVARRLAQDGAEVFLIPNDDPMEWGPVQREQHRLMFAMRAIECGRWLARADVAGGTSVTAPNGVETARVRTNEEASLDVQVGLSTAQTVYVKGGWRFGQVCFAALVALLAYAALIPRLVARRKLD